MGFEVLEIQPTPNPNAVKFVLDRAIASQPESFFSASAADSNPLAAEIFRLPGVASVLLLGDFVTVNKTPTAQWKTITGKVTEILKKAD